MARSSRDLRSEEYKTFLGFEQVPESVHIKLRLLGATLAYSYREDAIIALVSHAALMAAYGRDIKVRWAVDQSTPEWIWDQIVDQIAESTRKLLHP